MKNKKRLIKISLLAIILMVVIANMNISYGFAPLLGLSSAVGVVGLAAVLSTALQVGALAIATGVNAIITGITALSGIDNVVNGTGSGVNMISGVSNIVFNQSTITTASFFKGINNGYNINKFAEKIGEYYYIIRNLSIGILLFVLLYIGIRMAISTVAEQEAKYKKMLQNWAVSLALVFLLHYIIILTFVVNDTLVNALYDVAKVEYVTAVPAMLQSGVLLVEGLVPVIGWPEVIVYVMLTVATVAFLITYIKRVITLGFLIVISPLITITYSIDKIGDGKSQALNTWLREFVYTVLIQPFHCIIYIVFVKTSLEMTVGPLDGIVNAVLAIASILFMMKAEGIVKNIFGLKANSMGDTMKMGTMALGFATGFFKNMGGGDKGRVPEMKGDNTNTKTKTKGTDASSAPEKSGGTDTKVEADTSNGASTSNETDTPNATDSANRSDASANSKAPDDSKNALPEQQQIKDAISATKKPNADEFLRRIVAPTSTFLQRYSGVKGSKGVAMGLAKFAAKNGAAAFGAIAGAGLSDGSAAVSTAMAFKGAAEGIDGVATGIHNHEKAEENAQVFVDAYYDYIAELQRTNPDMSNDEKLLAWEKLMDKNPKELTEDFEIEAYNKGKLMNETGEAVGNKYFLMDTIREIQNGERQPSEGYVPKNYSGTQDSEE